MISRGIAHYSAFPPAFFLLTSAFLLHDLADGSGTHRVPAFADGEPQALLHRHRRDQLDHQLHVVSRHYHLRAGRKFGDSGHVRRPQIKLRPVTLEERRVPPPRLPWRAVSLT